MNGWFAERTPDGFAQAIQAALAARDALPEIGMRARLAVADNDTRFYVERWDDLLTRVIRESSAERGG